MLMDDDSTRSSSNRCQAGSYRKVVASSNDCSRLQSQQRHCNNQPRHLPTDERALLEEHTQKDDDEDNYSANADAADSSPKASNTDSSNPQVGNSASDQARALSHSTSPLEDISEMPKQKTPSLCKLLSRLTTNDTLQAIAPSDDEMDPMSTEDGVPSTDISC
jgi:hypothetical protein